LKSHLLLSTIGFLILSLNVHAEEATSSSSSTTVPTAGAMSMSLPGNSKYNDDHKITDAKLRADAGSLSKYSLKFNFSYYGPTLTDVSAKDQPNPDGTVGTYATAFAGNVGLRYRTSSDTSFSAGTGLKAIHPMHGMERMDVSTPYLNYDMTTRTESGIQLRQSPGVSIVTLPEYTKVGETATINYDLSSIYNIELSHFAVGLDSSISYFFYNRPYDSNDGRSSRGTIQLYPTVKYNFSDKLNVNTSTTLAWFSPRYRSNETILLNKAVTQRLGVGYAFSRDVYVFPYVTIYPTRAALDTTTMNFSTTFSLL
jgi:hypothetical protein